MSDLIFLAAEGVNDSGALGRSHQMRDNDPDFEGVLQPLIRSVVGAEVTFVGQKVGMLPSASLTDPQDIVGKRTRMASELADFRGCRFAIVHQDVDGPSDGSQDDAVIAWCAVRDAIHNGAQKAEAGGKGLPAGRVVPAAPLRTTEAWLLADAEFGNVAPAPEQLWGRAKESESDHPKQVLHRALRDANKRRATSTYREIAERLDPDRLESRCPVSFGPFRRRLARD